MPSCFAFWDLLSLCGAERRSGSTSEGRGLAAAELGAGPPVSEAGAGRAVSLPVSLPVEVPPEGARIAVVPVGYADGYPRALGNRASVLVGGRRCPIRGRVCMGMLMVDVSAVPEAKSGDEVVLLGRQGAECIDASELAGLVGTIPYEIVCSLGKSPHRRFVR